MRKVTDIQRHFDAAAADFEESMRAQSEERDRLFDEASKLKADNDSLKVQLEDAMEREGNVVAQVQVSNALATQHHTNAPSHEMFCMRRKKVSRVFLVVETAQRARSTT